jgi:hypothetical protein
MPAHASLRSSCLTALLLLVTTGCGPVEVGTALPVPGNVIRGLESNNGLTPNGLATNGLAFNGLAFNGLATPAFSAWFDLDPAQADIAMKYVVQCAAATGEVRTYTHGTQSYTWSGNLGLTPGWASGAPATETEQQLISSCLAAHVNKYGVNILLSVLGRDDRGRAIPYTSSELARFSQREGCFFGNLFTQEGIYAGSDQGLLSARESTARACGFTGNAAAMRDTCEPILYLGSCRTYCLLDATGTYYTSCTYNGKTYRPITTRLSKEDIYYCGDGVCQFTESCGTSRQYDNCGLDCGPCP